MEEVNIHTTVCIGEFKFTDDSVYADDAAISVSREDGGKGSLPILFDTKMMPSTVPFEEDP